MPYSIKAGLGMSLLALAGPVLAADGDWTGVWQGTLGKEAVVACFPPSSADNPRFYFVKNGTDQRLQAGKNPGEWQETSTGQAHWTLRLDGKTLSGERTLPQPAKKAKKGKKAQAQAPQKQAISLTRVPLPMTESDVCASEAYTLPRLEQQKITSGKQLTWHGKIYRTYSSADGKINGLELVFVNPKHPNALRINQTLRDNFRDHLNWYLRCRSDAGASSNWQYRAAPTLALWSRHWLTVVDDSESFCGGSYSNRTHEARLYDLRTGEAADPLSWFQDGTFRVIDQTQTLPAGGALGKIVREQALRQSQRGCQDVLQENQWYKVWPARGGMVFYPDLPHVAAACANEIVVPYPRILSFLTYRAQTAVKELQQEFK